MVSALVASATLLAACPPPCPTTPHQDAAGALTAYEYLRHPARSLRAEARVEQWGNDGRIRGTVLMFADRPESVRFDAMTQFGPAAILTSDGDRFALTDLRENRYLTGPTCPENIQRLLGIPMSGADVTLFLLGDTPKLATERRELTCVSGSYLATLHGSDGRRQEIELAIRDADRDRPPEEQRMRLTRSEVFTADGETEWRATYEDYRVLPDPGNDSGLGVAMPFQIRFEHPAENADTTVRFQEIDLNVEVPSDAFQQGPRPGIAVEEVSCTTVE
jgi:hypothetical protein